MKNIKIYTFFILTLLLPWGQTTLGQVSGAPIISSITVKPLTSHPGAVEIYWTDERVSDGYNIFKYFERSDTNDATFHQIATLIHPISQSYIDTIWANGHVKSEGYIIQSFMIDVNGDHQEEKSSNPGYTIYLNPIEYNACNMTNTLIWNRYVGQEIAYYNIYANGEDISNLDQEQNNIDTLFIHKTTENQDVQYEIRAFGKSPFNPDQIIRISTSNQSSIFTTPLKKPDRANFYINNITYDGAVANFTAKIDTSSDLLGHSLMLSADNNIFTELAFDTINKTSDTINFTHSTEGQPLYYKIYAIGVCEDTVLSTNIVQPIVLKIKDSNETEVTLDWNKSYVQSVEFYTLNFQIDGADKGNITATLPLTLNYEDLDGENKGELFCFSITAAETLGNTSLSNTVCTSRVPKIEIPNAFTPNGDRLNDYFGPFENYIKNVDLAEFKITIYDKYGGAIFVADNAASFWTGLSNRASLKYVPEGGYIYYLWFKTAQGKTYEKSGTINVVYP